MEDKVKIDIVFDNLTLPQLVFVQGVVIPEIQAIVDRYAKDIDDLGCLTC